jgi:hypothetical protein
LAGSEDLFLDIDLQRPFAGPPKVRYGREYQHADDQAEKTEQEGTVFCGSEVIKDRFKHEAWNR